MMMMMMMIMMMMMFLWNIPRHIVFSSIWHVLCSTLLANFCLTLLIRKTWDSYWKHVRNGAMFLPTRLCENVGLLLSRAMPNCLWIFHLYDFICVFVRK